jgi:hypothetical protein
MTNDKGRTEARALVVALLLSSCADEGPPQHVEWARVDGKPLTSQFERDSTACRAETKKVNRGNTESAKAASAQAKALNELFVGCMSRRGYAEIRQDIQ